MQCELMNEVITVSGVSCFGCSQCHVCHVSGDHSVRCVMFQVIAAHAVKIPVTPGLTAMHTGYLPIHSIHQLLKSRVFSRHKVPIKVIDSLVIFLCCAHTKCVAL